MIQRSEEIPSPVQIAILSHVKSLSLLAYQRISIIRKVTGGALNSFFLANLSKLIRSTNRMKKLVCFGALALILPFAQAATVNLGTEGFAIPGNNWPPGEAPSKAIDGLGGKYLNFGQQNTGIVVTPAAGQAPTSITAWAANDSPERDPASFWLGGTNGDSLTGDYTFIASGLLALPDTRNGGGAAELLESNSATASFTNSATFTNYLVVFPTLKNGGIANSMQVADVQLFDAANNGIFAPGDTILGVQVEGALVPEPSTGLLALIGLASLLRRRRR